MNTFIFMKEKKTLILKASLVLLNFGTWSTLIFAVESAKHSNYIPFTGSPAIDILLISAIITFLTSLYTKYTTPQEEMKKLKEDMKKLQKIAKEHMKNKEMDKVKKVQDEIMKINGEIMKKNFNMKNLIVTSIPLLLLFAWIKSEYEPFGEFLNIGITKLGWLGTYIWSSIIFGLIWRKVLKLA